MLMDYWENKLSARSKQKTQEKADKREEAITETEFNEMIGRKTE